MEPLNHFALGDAQITMEILAQSIFLILILTQGSTFHQADRSSLYTHTHAYIFTYIL